LVVVAGFIPKFNVPLESVVDGSSSLLAEPKGLTAAGLETLEAADTAGEHNRPAFTWELFTSNTDPVTDFEVTSTDAWLVVFTEEVTAVLPKLNKLFVVSVATGFRTLITVLVDDELKPPLLLLLSDADPWLVCSLEEGEMIDPLHAPRSAVEVVASCEESPADILGNEFGTF
jgi:hypothetical protein